MKITPAKGKRFGVMILFKDIKKGGRFYKTPQKIFGQNLYLSANTSVYGNCIILSNQNNPNALGIYRKRWAIETFFGFLKSKGFDFEATHMTDREKISELFPLLSIAFSWAFMLGEYLEKLSPPKRKKHGRKTISTFRIGLDYLQKILLNFYSPSSPQLLSHSLLFLSCT